MSEIAALRDEIRALRDEIRSAPALLTAREVAAKYRIRDRVVREMCRAGQLKCVVRTARNGGTAYLIDAADAALVLGAH